MMDTALWLPSTHPRTGPSPTASRLMSHSYQVVQGHAAVACYLGA
jgi:hypothetical protein